VALRRLEEAVSSLDRDLQSRLSPSLAAPALETLDVPAFQALAQRLVNLLQDGDPAAVELSAANDALLSRGLMATAESFKDSLRRFDFDEALALLRRALQRLGGPGSSTP
jgi:hypothetical protein